jgi:hypothetical protein
VNDTHTIACRCGTVRLEVSGPPIIGAECYCTSCRTASGRIAALPGAPAFQNAEGGTPYALYRKDRVRFLAGIDRLRQYRLRPNAHTRRVVATCCNTPVFTEFASGHWLSLFATLWPPATRPAMQLRTMTSDLPPEIQLDDRLPNARTQTLGFFAALLGAWIAMGFRVPRLDFAKGDLDV